MYLCALHSTDSQYVLKSLLSCKTRNQAYSWGLSWVTQGRDAWQMNPYVFSTLFLSFAIHSFCKVFVNYLLWIHLFPFLLMTLKQRVGFPLSWQLAIWLLNNIFHGFVSLWRSPLTICLTRGSQTTSDYSAIWWYFVLMRLYQAKFFIFSIILDLLKWGALWPWNLHC